MRTDRSFGIFISYRRREARGHAGALSWVLGQHFGPENIFRDVGTLRPGEDYMSAIQHAIAHSDVALILIGEMWATLEGPEGSPRIEIGDDPVRFEVAEALARRPYVIPVLLDDAQMPGLAQLPEPLQPLAALNAFRLQDGSWGEDAERLLVELKNVRDERAGKMTGEEIDRRVTVGDRPPLWVGRKGGLKGSTLAKDIREGSWRQQAYEISFDGTKPSSNWFSSSEFAVAVREI